MARKERKQAKAERRAQRSADRQSRTPIAPGGEDPDIAGIVPGPQPSPWEEFAPADTWTEEPESDKAEDDEA